MSIVFETLRLQFAEGAGSARWLRWLALALWLVCTSWPARVWADASSTVDVERAVWADPTGHARFEEVLQQVFRPAPAVIARGYQVGATWLRVTVPPSTAETLWVTILPQYLDDLQVYAGNARQVTALVARDARLLRLTLELPAVDTPPACSTAGTWQLEITEPQRAARWLAPAAVAAPHGSGATVSV